MKQLALFSVKFMLYLMHISTVYGQNRVDKAVFFPVSSYEQTASRPNLPQTASWPNLPQTAIESEKIAKCLDTSYHFLTEIYVDLDKKAIKDHLAALASYHYGPQDQLLLFFSMHGYFDPSGNAGFLVPRGGLVEDPTFDSWLLHDELRALVSKIQCPHILIAIDACYSGTFGPSTLRPISPAWDDAAYCEARIAAGLKKNTRYYLAAGGKEKVPAESSFCKKWLDALQNGKGDDGILTLTELQGVLSEAYPEPKWGSFSGHEDGTFLFVSKNACQIKENRDELSCSNARMQNTIVGWKDYLEHFPNGECAEYAAEEISWLMAVSKNSDAAFSLFRTMYPKSSHILEIENYLAVKMFKVPMIFIKGESFLMGSNDTYDDEKPAHKVKISDFYMSKYEVTVADFKQFIDETGYVTDAEKEGFSKRYNGKGWENWQDVTWRHDADGHLHSNTTYEHPVLHVSWNDAVAYCQWVSQKTGLNYRLPTEAEWEYAASSGGEFKRYTWGNEYPIGRKYGNFADETGSKKYNWEFKSTKNFTLTDDGEFFEKSSVVLLYNDGFAATSPVGRFEPNKLGLHDMNGNVWEFCSDWYNANYYRSAVEKNPQGPTDGKLKVIRGGSWFNGLDSQRINDRNWAAPNFRNNLIGFRVARS